ncbi:riboflavin synthase [Pseudochryseolinea flava]|uniref:Riboflavin synthase n=1 Tax=Pseudochryseolinea flava TaxID=2059302 RepID=A0A364XYI8_9BACT|nr:riboflavin synthase [Pseudochryseolinea flava]RAV98643.1 riboflavin synthase [Pseudochryseolinea flava]
MFTGIIESIALLKAIQNEGSNRHFWFSSVLTPELKVDQSVSHNGVCLTVVEIQGDQYRVTAIEETLIKSCLGNLQVKDKVNLERCMLNNGRFDGHIVQGHVDQTGVVESIENKDGSWLYHIQYDPSLGNVTVEKGSIAVNGVSLTCFNSRDNGFTVAIIPYTHEHTNFHQLKTGSVVNLEFDIVGKYIQRMMRMNKS